MKKTQTTLLFIIIFFVALALNFSKLDKNSLAGDESIYTTLALNVIDYSQIYPLFYTVGIYNISPPNNAPGTPEKVLKFHQDSLVYSNGTLKRIYLAKPPLVAWPVALSFKMFRQNAVTARLPSALFGTLLVITVFTLSLRILDRYSAFLASLLLASSIPWLEFHGVRHAGPDSLLALSATLALVAYYQYIDSRNYKWILCSGFFAAVGALCKGAYVPIALFLTMLISEVFFRRLFADDYDAKKNRYANHYLRAPLIFFLTALMPYLIWFTHSYFIKSDFIELFISQNITRHIESIDQSHIHDWKYYYVKIFNDFGFWISPILVTLCSIFLNARKDPKRYGLIWILVIWCFINLLFLTSSISKLYWYAYPIYPAIVILIAFGIKKIVECLKNRQVAMFIFVLAITIGLLVRLSNAWDKVNTPGEITEIDRFYNAIQKIPDAKIYLDKDLGFILQNNIVYLTLLRSRVHSLESRTPSSCDFIFTTKADELIRQHSFARATIMKFKKFWDGESNLSILNLCHDKLLYTVGYDFSPITYQANLDEGVDFTKSGYPDFIQATKGISVHENWGRWTDGNVVAFIFKKPLPKSFKLVLQGHAFVSMIGVPFTVKIGSTKQQVEFDGLDQVHTLAFNITEDQHLIELIIPSPSSPLEQKINNDGRKLGVGLIKLQIVK